MTINDAYNKGKKLLQNSNIENPSLESEILLLHTLKIDKKKFILDKDSVEISLIKQLKFLSLIKKRAEGRNIFHLTGKVNFMGYDLFVGEHTLIPRPETEEMVEILFKKMDENKNYKILDIGTGSGCIAVAIAKKFVNIKIDAIDRSRKALRTAKKNLQKHNIGKGKVNLSNKDIFNFNSDVKYDIIVSNPPYIPTAETEELLKNKTVSDPLISLDGGVDGLDFYRLFRNICLKNLKDGGFMIFEHGVNQRERIAEIFDKKTFKIEAYDDLS